VTFASANEKVANVSCDGRILAKSEGETTITVATTDGLSRTVKVTVTGGEVPSEYNMKVAVHILYNYKDEGNDDSYYGGTEVSDNTVTVTGDGTYTVKFDCSTDLSDAAKAKGVTNLNGIGALYLKDYDVTKGTNKKSPAGNGTLHYDSIKVDGNELLVDGTTAEQSAMKSGVFDTGNPLNVWDGSVVADDKLTLVPIDSEGNKMITFKDIDNPSVIEITFTMTGFTTSVETPADTAQPSETTAQPAETTAQPAETTAQPSEATGQPSETTAAPATATTAPSIVASEEAVTTTVEKGSVVTVSGGKYTVTDTDKKTVEYTAPTSTKKTSVSVLSQVTIEGAKYQVTSIAKNALKNNKKLRSVTIGSNVKKIGAGAFQGCSSLKKILVKSKKLTSIGANAFKGIQKKAVFTVPKAKYKAYKKLLKSKTGFKKKTMKIKKK
jgi:hypothetical protein